MRPKYFSSCSTLYCALLVFSLLLWYPLTASIDSWSIVNTLPGNASLFGAQAPTPTMVVMVGEYGTIRRSSDAGNTWSYPNSGVSGTLRSVAFYNADSGVAIGENGTVLRTQDSGKSWRSIENIYQKGLYGVCFIDPSNLVAVGEAGTILISGNSGEQWQQQTAVTSATLRCIAVAGARCVAVVSFPESRPLRSRGSERQDDPKNRLGSKASNS